MCLTGAGYVVETSTLSHVTQLGQYASNGLAVMDLDNNRMFLLSCSGSDAYIESYDAATLKLTARHVIQQWPFAHSFRKVAGNQLAMAKGGEMILLPISKLQAP